MTRSFQLLPGVLLLGLATLACHAAQAPVLELEDMALRTASGRLLTSAETHDVLVEALQQKRWIVDEDRPGRIDATVFSGGHSAKIRIDYQEGRYSIHHVSSTPGLRHDASQGIIHKRYNHWIDRLRVAIHARVPAR